MPVLNFICGLLHFYSKKIMLVLIHIFVRMNWLLCRISGTSFRVVVENDEQVELSFTRMWDSSLEGKYIPLNIDKRSLFNFYMYECIYKCINAIGITYIYIYIFIKLMKSILILLQVYIATWFLRLLLICHLRALAGMAWF